MLRRCVNVITLGAAGVMLAGCLFHHAEQIAPSPTVPLRARWNGTLESPQSLAGAGQIHVNSGMGPGTATDSSRTAVSITITNATAGGVHPWAVRQGQCGTDQGPFGAALSYPLLKIDGDGTASAQLTLTEPTPSTGQYYVYVLASPSNTGTIIACGNLAEPLHQ